MKITHLIIFIIGLSVLLTSCNIHTKDHIIKEAEEILASTETENHFTSEHFEYQEGLGEWLNSEQEYIENEDGDNSAGIICISGGNFSHVGERLYFPLTKQTQLSTGDNFWAYVSTKTGEKHYLCPDPLCGHTQNSGCPYVDFQQLTFHPYTDTMVYAVRQNFSESGISSIYKIDLQQNKIQKIYNATALESEADIDYITIYFILNDTLYFRDRFVYEEIVEGEKIITEKTYLLGLNLETNKVDVLNNDFDEYIGSIYIIKDSVFYTNLDERTVYVTDFSMEESRKILTYDKGYAIYNKYYDENTEELYLLISQTDIHNSSSIVEDTASIQCVLYCIDSELNCHEIPMPSSLLLDVQLTNKYIYYTTYDPINYKEPPYTRNAVDVAGNKIYRVLRTETNTPELVFDGRGELFFRDFYVTGDYLYMEYYALVVRDEGQVFRRMGSSIRINTKENTLKWMNLD